MNQIPSPALSDQASTFLSNSALSNYHTTPTMLQQPYQGKGYVQANGLITPVASPVKSAFSQNLGRSEASYAHLPPAMTPPPDEPNFGESTVQQKKAERQTKISDHLKSTKKSGTGRPRGRPRKDGLLPGSVPKPVKATKIDKAGLVERLEADSLPATANAIESFSARPGVLMLNGGHLKEAFDELQHPAQIIPRSADSSASSQNLGSSHRKRRTSSTESPTKRTRADVGLAEQSYLTRPQQTVRFPPSPPLTETARDKSQSPVLDFLASPIMDEDSSEQDLAALALFVDPMTGTANLAGSHSSLPALSYASTSSSSSNSLASSFGVYFDQSISLSTPSNAHLNSHKMTKADVPGMGRCLWERAALVARLGEEAAQRAVASAEATTNRRSTLFDSGSSPPKVNISLPVASRTALNKDDLVRSWLDADVNETEESTVPQQATFFQPNQLAFPAVDDEEEWYGREQGEEEYVLQRGGKSLRVLRKTKSSPQSMHAHLPSLHPQPFLRTPSPTRSRPSSRLSRSQSFGNDTFIACVCGQQDDQGDDMVQCDSCRSWLHLRCLNISSVQDLPADQDWFCFRCSGHVPPFSTSNSRHAIASPLNTVRKEPVFVHSSPHISQYANGFAHLDAPLSLHAAGPNTPMFNHIGRSRQLRPARRSSHSWQSHTPHLSRSGTSSQHSFSPKTPAVGFFPPSSPKPRIGSGNPVNWSEDSLNFGSPRLYSSWDSHYGTQTPSRSAGVSLTHDWSFPTPGYSNKRTSSYNGTHYASQDFFHTLHAPRPPSGPHQHHVTFETPPGSSPNLSRKHRRGSSLLGQHSSLSPFPGSQPRHSAMKLAPPVMTRQGSGLGIGFLEEGVIF